MKREMRKKEEKEIKANTFWPASPDRMSNAEAPIPLTIESIGPQRRAPKGGQPRGITALDQLRDRLTWP